MCIVQRRAPYHIKKINVSRVGNFSKCLVFFLALSVKGLKALNLTNPPSTIEAELEDYGGSTSVSIEEVGAVGVWDEGVTTLGHTISVFSKQGLRSGSRQ